jgi:hypothetical protein
MVDQKVLVSRIEGSDEGIAYLQDNLEGRNPSLTGGEKGGAENACD